MNKDLNKLDTHCFEVMEECSWWIHFLRSDAPEAVRENTLGRYSNPTEKEENHHG